MKKQQARRLRESHGPVRVTEQQRTAIDRLLKADPKVSGVLGQEITSIAIQGTIIFVEYDKDLTKSLAIFRSAPGWEEVLDILENRQPLTEPA